MPAVPQRWHVYLVALDPRVEAVRDEVRRAVLEFLDLL